MSNLIIVALILSHYKIVHDLAACVNITKAQHTKADKNKHTKKNSISTSNVDHKPQAPGSLDNHDANKKKKIKIKDKKKRINIKTIR